MFFNYLRGIDGVGTSMAVAGLVLGHISYLTGREKEMEKQEK